MPLHLLGKKSWNVYNTDNIERVRRDEAAARDREQAEEQRQQEIDAERRLAILRGEVPPPLPPPSSSREDQDRDRDRDHDGKRHNHISRDDRRGRDGQDGFGGRERRKRKRHGEDDTDFEMRIARDRAATTTTPAGNQAPHSNGDEADGRALVPRQHKSSDAPLTDASGHIDLFGGHQAAESASARGRGRKNAEAEAEKAEKKREYEDQYRMRFSSAAGYQASASGPWYAPASSSSVRRRGQYGGVSDAQVVEAVEGKDAFGRPDPGRKDRDAARIEANDPLAMMKRGAAKVRQVDKERQAANEERERELRRLRREERRSEKRRKRRDDDDNGDDVSDDLEGFSLDHDSLRDKRNVHHDAGDEDRRRHRHRHRQHRHGSPHRSSRSDGRRRDRDT